MTKSPQMGTDSEGICSLVFAYQEEHQQKMFEHPGQGNSFCECQHLSSLTPILVQGACGKKWPRKQGWRLYKLSNIQNLVNYAILATGTGEFPNSQEQRSALSPQYGTQYEPAISWQVDYIR